MMAEDDDKDARVNPDAVEDLLEEKDEPEEEGALFEEEEESY